MKAVSGKRFGRILEENGWELQRVTIGHHLYIRKGSLLRISLPVRGNDLLKVGLQQHLMKVVSRFSKATANPDKAKVNPEQAIKPKVTPS